MIVSVDSQSLAMRHPIVSTSILLVLISLKACSSFVFTNANYDGIQVGIPFTLTWEDANGPVTLGLLYKNTSSSDQESSIIGSTH